MREVVKCGDIEDGCCTGCCLNGSPRTCTTQHKRGDDGCVEKGHIYKWADEQEVVTDSIELMKIEIDNNVVKLVKAFYEGWEADYWDQYRISSRVCMIEITTENNNESLCKEFRQRPWISDDADINEWRKVYHGSLKFVDEFNSMLEKCR